MRDLDLYFEFERMEEAGKDDGGAVTLTCLAANSPLTDEIWSQVISPTLVHPSNDPATFLTLDYDSALLSYYDTVICSSSTLLDDARHNPYRHVILPMAMASEGLYHATLAVSASTLRLSEPRYGVAALKHGQKAIQALIRILKRGIQSDADMDELLGLALMLCWYEITDGCRPSWVTHLNGIRAISARCRKPPTFTHDSSHSSNLRQFFNRYFAFHLVLARTAFRVDSDVAPGKYTMFKSPDAPTHLVRKIYEPSLDRALVSGSGGSGDSNSAGGENLQELAATSTNFLALTMPLEELDEIDPYMGFSNSLLLLINEIADLAWRSPPKCMDANAISLRVKAFHLKESLDKLRQRPPGQLVSAATSGNDCPDRDLATKFMIIAEANRLGALLFLHEICSNRFRFEGSYHNPETYDDYDQNTLLPRFPEEDKHNYIRAILDLIGHNLPWIIRTAALPLWPLFLAGCCAVTEEDRMTVMVIFEESEQLKRFGNIRPAREVVEMVWRQHDLGVQDDRKRRRAAAVATGRPVEKNTQSERFIWERAMKMLGGWKLSLT
ncbi:hypothetical protein BBP40_005878 [Aspergillus hancockii]|nr:hypothetical protein BBP40_005878 [Aspergillus hancockii]